MTKASLLAAAASLAIIPAASAGSPWPPAGCVKIKTAMQAYAAAHESQLRAETSLPAYASAVTVLLQRMGRYAQCLERSGRR